ncbi:putative methyltransferase C9orf114 homolog [Cucurbita maxima]|uniref:Methyltransferase C9orf114 homolog n=1 Tax=Cucurbita maxima TaxID=3661 RepID=A0A6J1IDX8_CUCMA|nr:putative methyltransferase C9orf114 homolog [Cucurbita maxima]
MNLKYLETPQYLRKALFPKHNNLRFVGMLPPLDAPHHLRNHEWGPYREGCICQNEMENRKACSCCAGSGGKRTLKVEMKWKVKKNTQGWKWWQKDTQSRNEMESEEEYAGMKN